MGNFFNYGYGEDYPSPVTVYPASSLVSAQVNPIYVYTLLSLDTHPNTLFIYLANSSSASSYTSQNLNSRFYRILSRLLRPNKFLLILVL